ncbi:MAG: hypothetical protein ACFFEO_09215, partial [Candidatus Thorarchaeota archaeon]
GIGLIPPAYLISGYMRDQVDAEIPSTFLTIRQGFANYLEANFIGLGIPDVLNEIRMSNTRIPSLERLTIYDFLYMVDTIPHFLQEIKNNMIEKFPSMINGSRTAQFINNTIFAVMNETALSEGQVRVLFFNDYLFEDNHENASIEGISEYGLGIASLNYSTLARTRILDGYGIYPGLLTDIIYGGGVIDWLDFYDLAEANIGNNRTEMESAYNCTWSSGQLQNVSQYIRNYMWDTIIKAMYFPKTIETYGMEMFYGQWANFSFYEDHVNFRPFLDPLTTSLRGFEIAQIISNNPVPSGISLTVCENLWDVSNPLSFVNQSGLIKWFQASNSSYALYDQRLTELNSTFGLTLEQFQSITTWLFDLETTWSLRFVVISVLIQLPKPFGFQTFPIVHRDNVFYEQWANGTVVKGGLNLNLASNLKGYEAGVPTRTNISRTIAKAFFNVNNISSFMSKIGIFKWVQAQQGNISAQNELMNTFDLSTSQLNLLLNWLFVTFRDNLVPYFVLSLVGKTLNQLAFDEYPRQWGYGTYNESSIDLTDYASTGFSYLGWELGIPTDITLNLTQTTALLDVSNSLSFANRKGISKWLRSVEIQEYYNEIIQAFSITNTEYTQIYNYIMYVKENYVIPLLIQESIFQMDPYTISELYQTGILIGAIIIIAAGIIFGVLDFL